MVVALHIAPIMASELSRIRKNHPKAGSPRGIA
jgi:hypothetical protein